MEQELTTALIREVASNSAKVESLTTSVHVHDQRQEDRMRRLEELVTALHRGMDARVKTLEIGHSRLSLVVFGIGAPATLAAFGAALRLILG